WSIPRLSNFAASDENANVPTKLTTPIRCESLIGALERASRSNIWSRRRQPANDARLTIGRPCLGKSPLRGHSPKPHRSRRRVSPASDYPVIWTNHLSRRSLFEGAALSLRIISPTPIDDRPPIPEEHRPASAQPHRSRREGASTGSIARGPGGQ